MTLINPLTEHAHPTMQVIWSERTMIELERAWWISIMLIQKALDLDIPGDAILSSQRHKQITNHEMDHLLARIRDRELTTRHDLKARLEIFCEDAGHEYHHLGLTSADVVENVWQIRIRHSLTHLRRLYPLDISHLDADEELGGSGSDCYVLRGVHGAVGTDQDQLNLLGSADKVHRLNAWLCRRWGFPDYARTVPQVMHRSQDLAVLAPVVSQVKGRLADAARDDPSKTAAVLAWMACFNGYVTMIAGYAGDTWNEGDVSSSVVRRVAVPNLLLAISSALNLTGA